ncbi:MAG: molecular chaperone HtpG [Candidatus Poribacteria bacterium]|nr:molecular chaperone HtpG [Candidatus Poribacteria bacterium]
MSSDKPQALEEFEYQAEMKQLLHLIVHSLYSHREVFLREVISNASDALNQVRFRQLTDKDIVSPDAPLRINISVDSEAQTFSIADTGIGMTKEDLVDRVGTIASSGTVAFLERLKEEGKPFDANMIGQFGIGFYSVFMVTDQVVIETRHADQGSKGYRWESTGESKFTVEEFPREERGTKISFKLKDDAKEFGEEHQVNETIKKYSNFADFPIHVNGEQVNTISALWQKSKNEVTDEELEEFYKFISNDFGSILGHMHLAIEGQVNFKAMVFVPESAPFNFLRGDDLKSLQLYANRIFIQEDCKELLPEYLRFVAGVVDTEDLPLNVSREVTQSSPVMGKIKNVLTGRILSLLEDWAKNDQEKYDKFFANFGLLFKTGLSTDFGNRDRLIDLLRFESTKTEKGKFTSLKDYAAGMQEDQKEIYYLTGENREAVELNPNLEYFRKRGIEVLFFIDPADIFNIPQLHEYDEKPIKGIEAADLDLKSDKESEADSLTEDESKSLISLFKDTLGDKVEDVVESKRLVDSAATLVVGASGMDRQMERMMKMMNQEIPGSKKILEINPSHPLIKNLAQIHEKNGDESLLKSCVLQVFEGALLIDGNVDSPTEFVARMTEIMEHATR